MYTVWYNKKQEQTQTSFHVDGFESSTPEKEILIDFVKAKDSFFSKSTIKELASFCAVPTVSSDESTAFTSCLTEEISVSDFNDQNLI